MPILIAVASYLGGLLTALFLLWAFVTGSKIPTAVRDDELEAVYKRVRNGTTTADDEQILREALQFEIDSRGY